jgi:hypothetical protein
MASDNDLAGIQQILRHPAYCIEDGVEAIGVAFTTGNVDIALELLSYPGAFDDYRAAPFNVYKTMDTLEAAVNGYKRT